MDPTTPRVMHWSYRLRSSYESAGPRTLRAAARAAARCCAASVSGGIFPSGGSITIQGRLFFAP